MHQGVRGQSKEEEVEGPQVSGLLKKRTRTTANEGEFEIDFYL